MSPEAGGPGAHEVPVVAAVAMDADRFLVALRPEGKRHGGCWEFPGGKRRPGETERGALERELQEELQVKVTKVSDALHEARDPDSPFVVRFLPVEIRGEPQATEHDDVRWVRRGSLAALPLAPADRHFVRHVLSPDGSSDRVP